MIKSAQQSSTRVNNSCAMSNSTSVWDLESPCLYLLILPSARIYTLCPAKADYLGPRPARPIFARGRGWQRRSPHPPRWDRSNPWNKCERPKKSVQIQNVPKTFVIDFLVPNWLTTCPPWSNKKTDTAADKITIFTLMLSILHKFIKGLPFGVLKIRKVRLFGQ